MERTRLNTTTPSTTIQATSTSPDCHDSKSAPCIPTVLTTDNTYSYHPCIYIYMLPPPRTHILYDFTSKNTVSCCFCSRCETCPYRPIFCMTPPAGKVLVQVLFLLRPLLSAFVSVFIIRIVISILTTHKHDYYHCHCPCHVQYQYHHTYCKMNTVSISMILVLLLACFYYYQV